MAKRILLSVVEMGGYPNFKPLYEQAGFEVYGREPAALKVAGSNYDEFLMSRKLR